MLLVPELASGRGSGHLKRCLHLLGLFSGAELYLPERNALTEALVTGDYASRVTSEVNGAYDRVIVDRFDISAREATVLSEAGLTIGIDCGGLGRDYLDYLVDTLPRLDSAIANVSGPNYLFLPSSKTRVQEPQHTIVTFGGEDPAHLTESVAATLAHSEELKDAIFVRPVGRALGTMPDGAQIIDPVSSASELLRTAAVVVTSFGLTAYEARAVGASVVTVNPTAYHEQLAVRGGFVSAGLRGRGARSVVRAIRRIRKQGGTPPVSPATETVSELPALIQSLVSPLRRACPVHPGERGRAVWRGADKSYMVCEKCGLTYLERFTRDEEDYSEEYFMDEYRQQYGRTYLEDFEHIASMAQRRLHSIRSAMSDSGGSLLDIGCAYGPFLREARDAGYEPFGVDVAPEAIAYVQRELAISAAAGDFRELDLESLFGLKRFDVVTMWYVIEHFPDLDRVLSVIARIVRPGGVFAFSTPHGGGVSARRNTDHFFSASPRDHFSVWDSQSAERILNEYGFRMATRVVTGHHPERYPIGRSPGIGRAMASAHSRLFGWGDTFEVYAVREESA